MRKLFSRLFHRGAPPAELCPELAVLLEAYTEALEASTTAHTAYVDALNSGQEAARRALARVDEAEEALALAFERLKAHTDIHRCSEK